MADQRKYPWLPTPMECEAAKLNQLYVVRCCPRRLPTADFEDSIYMDPAYLARRAHAPKRASLWRRLVLWVLGE